VNLLAATTNNAELTPLTKLLKPLDDASVALQSNTTPTLCLVRGHMRGILSLLSVATTHTPKADTVRKLLCTAVEARYKEYIMMGWQETPTFVLAAGGAGFALAAPVSVRLARTDILSLLRT
jgi:hypothetical protein